MNGEETLFSKAVCAYNAAYVLYQNKDADEMFLNIIGYHLQQSVELCLKYQLEKEGIEYPKTHNIDQLIRIGRENDADIVVTDYIDEHSEMLTLWEAQTRYVIGYRLELRKTEAALNGVREFLEMVVEHEKGIEKEDLEESVECEQNAEQKKCEQNIGQEEQNQKDDLER